MPSKEYLTVFVKEFLTPEYQETPVPAATAAMNKYAAQGWRVVSAVPGTNGQTYSGLFITLERG